MTNTTVSHCEDDDFNVEPLVDCHQLNMIGTYCVILFILCFSANSFLIWLFIKFKELRTPINRLLMTLIAMNFIGTFLELPFIAYSAFKCRFQFGQSGCSLQAFTVYFIACVTIYLHAIISFERYYLVAKPFTTFSFKTWIRLLSLIIALSLFWSCAPLFGWSYYSLEGVLISCSIEWRAHNMNVISYNFTILIFIYILPIIIISLTSYRTVMIIKSSTRSLNLNQQSLEFRLRYRREIHVTTVTFLLFLSYTAAWTPYALVSMVTSFYDENIVGPLAATIPALIAKTSLLWPAVLTIFGNKEIHRKLVNYYKANETFLPFIKSKQQS